MCSSFRFSSAFSFCSASTDWVSGGVTFGASEENLLRAIPLLPFYNNCQGCGDFEMVTGLVDSYNVLLSGALDDMQSVANAFLALYGMQGTTQKDIDQANRTRILSLSEGGRAEFVVKNLNHEALGQLESNLRRSILQPPTLTAPLPQRPKRGIQRLR